MKAVRLTTHTCRPWRITALPRRVCFLCFLFFLCFLCALSILPAPAAAQEGAPENALENTSWQLVAIYGFNNTTFIPHNPEDYKLRFRSGSRLQIEADCNEAGATWTQEGGNLTLTAMVSTRKLCVQPSLFNRYIMNLDRAASYELDGHRLIIRTAVESDRMEFEPYVFTPSF